jgi:hypothetical protein
MRFVARIVKRLAIAFGAFVSLLLILAFMGSFWGFTPLPKPPQGVRIEPLLPVLVRQDLKPNNAALYYAKAAGILHGYNQSDESKSQMEAVIAGDFSGDTKAIEHTIADCQPALKLGRYGAQMSFCNMPSLDPAILSAQFLSPLRQLASLLVAEGKLAERHGKSDQAIVNYLAVVKLGSDFSKGGPLLLDLVGAAITRMGSQAVRAWTLQQAPSQADTEKILATLTRIASEQMPFAETLRYELRSIKLGFPDLRMFQGMTIAYFDALFGDLIRDAEKPFGESDTQAIMQKWHLDKRPSWYWVFNRPVPRILLSLMIPSTRSARVKTIQVQVDVEATIVVCALKDYQLVHGDVPEHLSNLVPDFLPSIPIDPFDGKTLRYRREGTEWVIWSVGPDLKDDNAAWHEFKYRKNEKHPGGDIFFKSTEPQDDLAYYLSQKDSEAKP